MGVINRGIRNAFRNMTRTGSIVFILAISISLALVMLLSMKAVQLKIESVKSSIGNTITVSPAGVRGSEGGGELLTEDNIATISNISHVSGVVETLSDRLTPETDTDLEASLEMGSFGKRMQEKDSAASSDSSSGSVDVPVADSTRPEPKMSINVTGTNDTSNTNALGVTSLSITSGELFSGNEDTNIAILGTELATKNGLTVGSTFTAYDTTITVIGIYDSGNTFTNSSIIMPIKTLQTLSDQAGLVSSVIVESDSMDNIATVQSDLETNLGDAVDVVSSQDTVSETIEPLENIKTITFYSLIGSLVAGSIIIFLTMLMIVRERRREIGALKAIGASNTTVILQFITESLTLTFLASIVGIIGGFAFSNPVLNALVSSSTTSSVTQPGGSGGMPGGGGELMAKAVGSAQGMQNTLNDLQTIIGFDVIIYGILAAFVIAVIGSSIPAFFISKIRPAEVMRSE